MYFSIKGTIIKILATRKNRPKLPDAYAKAGIYRIQCMANGKFYVGSTGLSIRKRWGQHVSALTNNTHTNPHLQASWNKYGESAFIFGVVEFCPVASSIEREDFYIKSMKPEYNYGPARNPRLGAKLTEEQKAYISKRLKECMTPARREQNRRSSKLQDKTVQIEAMRRKSRKPIIDQDGRVWPSLTHVCNFYGINNSTLTHHLKKKSKPIYGKYSFKFVI